MFSRCCGTRLSTVSQSPVSFHVPALNYHKVAEIPPGVRHPENYVRPAQFRSQLRLLRAAGFDSITVSDYLAYRRGELELPRRPVMLTFDDGYRSNYDIALPIVREHAFTATVFLVSGMIGGTNAWDTDELQEPLLDSHQIRELQSDGIDFQSHTRTHASLPSLSDAQALDELKGSKCELEQMLGKSVDTIAYPWSRHDVRVERVAEEAGYLGGVIVRRRMNFDDTPLFALRRIGISYTTSRARFAWDLLRLRWRGE
jgi:peptidoglycan/xylan/chitin deacetylase (PgdA/CDA1 family)